MMTSVPEPHTVVKLAFAARRYVPLIVGLVCLAAHMTPSCSALETGQLVVAVTDGQGGNVAFRIHLKDASGEVVHPESVPFWHDHFVVETGHALELPVGEYHYDIEKGPEFLRLSGKLTIAEDETTTLEHRFERLVDMRELGWFSADLHLHRPLHEVPLLMEAEDLDFAAAVSWWNNSNVWTDFPVPTQTFQATTTDPSGSERLFTLLAGEDEREGGALLYFGLDKPIDIRTDDREFPSPLTFAERARSENEATWIDIEKPFWWDTPTWLASGRMNSIGLANNHMCRDQMLASEAWGRPRDEQRLPSPLGNGYWTQEIYYHALNAGFRLPPSAGSASGVLPNPVGYNRVYVRAEAPLTAESWFAALRQGRCFVSNGPLLIVTANDQPPGGKLELADANQLTVRLAIRLLSQDPVSAVEVIHNGRVHKRIPALALTDQTLESVVTFDEPGWFLVRAVTNLEHTFRFASTAAWDLSAPGQIAPPIQRESVRFFLDWSQERIARVQANVADEARRREVLAPHELALEFWKERLMQATPSQQPAPPDPRSMLEGPTSLGLRVVSFNILQAGANAANVGFFNDDFGGSRLDEIADIIRQSQADVVGVQEGPGSDALLEALGEGWSRVGSIYSRLPIEPVAATGPLDAARVDCGAVGSVVVLNGHWSPSPYGPFLVQDALKERGAPRDLAMFAQEILAASDKPSGPRGYDITLENVTSLLERGERVILTGDFNEPSHLDWTDRAAREGLDRWVDNSTETALRFPIAWTGSRRLADAGMRDAYRTAHPDEVAAPGITWTPAYPANTPGRRPYGDQVLDRIDMIYGGGMGLEITAAAIIGETNSAAELESPTRWPSDHRAVLADFLLRRP